MSPALHPYSFGAPGSRYARHAPVVSAVLARGVGVAGELLTDGAGRGVTALLPILFLDVDGPLNPFAAKPTRRPSGYVTHRLMPAGWTGTTRGRRPKPLRVWLNPDHGPALTGLPVELVWATTWEHEANRLIGPRIGLPSLPVVEWPRKGTPKPTGCSGRLGISLSTQRVGRSRGSMTRSRLRTGDGARSGTRPRRCFNRSILGGGCARVTSPRSPGGPRWPRRRPLTVNLLRSRMAALTSHEWARPRDPESGCGTAAPESRRASRGTRGVRRCVDSAVCLRGCVPGLSRSRQGSGCAGRTAWACSSTVRGPFGHILVCWFPCSMTGS